MWCLSRPFRLKESSRKGQCSWLLTYFFVIYFILFYLLIILFVYISNDIPPSLLPLHNNPIQYMPSPPSLLPLWGCSPIYLLTPAQLLLHWPKLEHQKFTRSGVSPPIYVRQGHHLLHMYHEPLIPPCTLLGWWCSPWKHWVFWPPKTVHPMGFYPLLLLHSFYMLPHRGPWAHSDGCF